MTKQKKTSKRAAHRIAILGEWLTLNRSTGQAYFNVYDPERGCSVRKYQGKLYAQLDATGEPVGPMIPETLERAQRWIMERLATGSASLHPERDEDLTVRQLVDAFMREREEVAESLGYTKDQRAQLSHFKGAFAPLVKLYGSKLSKDFGVRHLAAVRHDMLKSGRLSLWTLRNRVYRIKTLFKWAAGLGMIPRNVSLGLSELLSIKEREHPTIKQTTVRTPAPLADVKATLPFLSRQLQAIVKLQALTGARPSEVLCLRPMDVERSGDVWIARPSKHKNSWRGAGYEREIELCREAQFVLHPFLENRLPTAPLFSPREAETERLQGCPGSRAVPEVVGDSYSSDVYRRAVERACDKAGVERWTPYQLRHLSGSVAEAELDPVHAGAFLDHADETVTRRYHQDTQRKRMKRETARIVGEVVAKGLGLESA